MSADQQMVSIWLYIVVGPSIAILWHEAAHALFALSLTRDEVTLRVGFGPSIGGRVGRLELRFGTVLLGGLCSYAAVERRGDRALIAAVGPISSVFLAALAYSLHAPLVQGHQWFLADLAGAVAWTSAAAALLSAAPIRYPGMGGDSDGLAVLRALFPTNRLVLRPTSMENRPERPLRAPFAIVLALVIPVAFIVSLTLGLITASLFGLVYVAERHA